MRDLPADTGMSPADVARRLRVSPAKVRAWITAGELRAVDVASATSSRPRLIILPEDFAIFAERRAVGPTAAPKRPSPRRRKEAKEWV